ncbi:MAG: hypothetical protein QM811_21075 [Pirellulales bacterium]
MDADVLLVRRQSRPQVRRRGSCRETVHAELVQAIPRGATTAQTKAALEAHGFACTATEAPGQSLFATRRGGSFVGGHQWNVICVFDGDRLVDLYVTEK